MHFTDDAARLLRDNLRSTYAKVAAAAAVLLAWTAPFKAAEYLGIESKSHRWLAVCAFYAVLAIVTLVAFLIRSLRQAYERLGPGVPSQKALADLAAKFIGVEKQVMIDECQIHADGSSVSVNDVTLFAHTHRVTKLEQTSSTPSAPEVTNGSLDVKAEARRDRDMRITSEILRQTSKQCFWSINFLPELRKGNSAQFRYRITTASGSFARSLEEMKSRGLDREHYSHQISVPTAQFTVKLTFDDEITDLSYDVWLGRGGLRHFEEYVRVAQSDYFSTGLDADGKLFGQLCVSYPVYGLRYVITWKPGEAIENGRP